MTANFSRSITTKTKGELSLFTKFQFNFLNEIFFKILEKRGDSSSPYSLWIKENKMKTINNYDVYKAKIFEQINTFAKLQNGTQSKDQTCLSLLTTITVKGGDND